MKNFSAKHRFYLFLSVVFSLLCINAYSSDIIAGNDSTSSRARFGSAGQPFRFAFLTDTHISIGYKSIKDLQECISDINSRKDLSFAVFNGDITNFGSDAEIYEAKKIISRLKIPYFIIAGNHDANWSESGCNTFKKVFGYERFKFEAGGIIFIGTNSGPNMRMSPALVPHDSMLWLDSLSATIGKKQPVFFFNHYPVDNSILNYSDLLSILKRMNTQIIFTGHLHANKVKDYEGIPGFVGRSTLHGRNYGTGYTIVDVRGSLVSFSERREITPAAVGEKGRISGKPVWKTLDPWYVIRMSRGVPFDDSIKYPGPDFTVNSEYPGVKTVWKVHDLADVGAGAAAVTDRSGNLKQVIYDDEKGMVFAFSADGHRLWQFDTGNKIFSTPAVQSGIAVVGCSDGFIYALNTADGKLKWKYKCDKSVLASPAIFRGKIYIGASDGKFRALALKTGKLIWEYDGVGGFVETRALVDRKQVVFGDWANTLYSLDPGTGKLQWKWRNDYKGKMYSPASVWPVKANGHIMIATPERVSYGIDAKTGRQLWRIEGGRESIGLSADKKCYYVKFMRDTVAAFGTESPDVQWKVSAGFGYEISPSPIASDDKTVFVPTDKGYVIALDAKDGSLLWKHRISVGLINNIVPLGGRRILVSSMDGYISLLQY
ncbi:MAG: PQQ-binding-like beta-propeller repeat protein [Bacteroidales bacterium]|jgi:outer membrane protein assembly factor BamB/predicted phosphodiesterase|nr:PQQ-binding-like beta-propeller repeat protein [Bacteroidales bacterium]